MAKKSYKYGIGVQLFAENRNIDQVVNYLNKKLDTVDTEQEISLDLKNIKSADEALEVLQKLDTALEGLKVDGKLDDFGAQIAENLSKMMENLKKYGGMLENFMTKFSSIGALNSKTGKGNLTALIEEMNVFFEKFKELSGLKIDVSDMKPSEQMEAAKNALASFSEAISNGALPAIEHLSSATGETAKQFKEIENPDYTKLQGELEKTTQLVENLKEAWKSLINGDASINAPSMDNLEEFEKYAQTLKDEYLDLQDKIDVALTNGASDVELDKLNAQLLINVANMEAVKSAVDGAGRSFQFASEELTAFYKASEDAINGAQYIIDDAIGQYEPGSVSKSDLYKSLVAEKKRIDKLLQTTPTTIEVEVDTPQAIEIPVTPQIETKTIDEQVEELKQRFNKLFGSLDDRLSIDLDFNDIFEQVKNNLISIEDAWDQIVKRQADYQDRATRTWYESATSKDMGCSYEEYQDLEDSLTKERAGNEWLSEELTRVRNELDQANETIKDLRSQLQEAMSSTGTGTGTGADFIQELEQLDKLQLALEEVRVAINQKTDAFTLEGSTVIGVVAREIDSLSDLKKAVDAVTESAEKKTVAMSKVETPVETPPVIDKQALATEEKHNLALQIRAKLYQKLKQYAEDYVNAYPISKMRNSKIFSKYDNYGVLQPGRGYSAKNIKDNQVSHAHIKEIIKLIQDFRESSMPQSLVEKTISSYTDDLASCVNTYRNFEEARALFGKKELELWDEVIRRIQLAQDAEEAYGKYLTASREIHTTARQLGDPNVELTSSDYGALWSLRDNGDVEGVLNFLTEKFKIELEPEIKSGAILDEVQDNVRATPATIEVKADTEQAEQAIENIKEEQKEASQPTTSMFDGEIEKLNTLKSELKKLGDSINSYSTTLSEKFNVELTALEQRVGDITKKINDAVEVLTKVSSGQISEIGTSEGSLSGEGENGESGLISTLQSINGSLSRLVGGGEQQAIKIADIDGLQTEIKNLITALGKPIDINELPNISKTLTNIQSAVNTISQIMQAGGTGIPQNTITELANAAKAMNRLSTNLEKPAQNNQVSGNKSKTPNGAGVELDEKGFTDENELLQKAQELINAYAKQGIKATASIKKNGTAAIKIVQQFGNIFRTTTGILNTKGLEIENVFTSMSNSIQTNLADIKAQVENSSLDMNSSQVKQFMTAYADLITMAEQYETKQGQLTNKNIANWNKQIQLVQDLGKALMTLISKQNTFNVDNAQNGATKKLDTLIDKIEKAGLYTGELQTDAETLKNSIANIGDATGLDTFNNDLNNLDNKYQRTIELQKEYNYLLKEFKDLTAMQIQMKGMDKTSTEYAAQAQLYKNRKGKFDNRYQTFKQNSLSSMFDLDVEMGTVTTSTLGNNIAQQAVVLDTYVAQVEKAGLYTDEFGKEIDKLKTELLAIDSIDVFGDYLDSMRKVDSQYQDLIALQKELNTLIQLQKDIGALKIDLTKSNLTAEARQKIKDQIDNKQKDYDIKKSTFDARLQKNSFSGALDAANQLKKTTDEIDQKVKAAEANVKNAFVGFQNQYETAIVNHNMIKKQLEGITLSSDQGDILGAYQTTIDRLIELKTQLSGKKASELTENERIQWKTATKEAQQYYQELKKIASAKAPKNNVNSIIGNLLGGPEQAQEQIDAIVGSGKMKGVSDEVKKLATSYQELYTKVAEYEATLKTMNPNDTKFKTTNEQLQVTSEQLTEVTKKLTYFIDAYDDIKTNKINFIDAGQMATEDSIFSNMQSFMKIDDMKSWEGQAKVIRNASQEIVGLSRNYRTADDVLKTVTITYDRLTGTLKQSTGVVRTVQSKWEEFAGRLSNKFKELAAYALSFMSFYDAIRVVRQGITYVQEIDDALVELKKVTDETEESYAKFLQTASKTASQIGSTVSEFTNATANFARLGYSLEESAQLAEAASIYKNVGDGIDSIDQASESIISAMKAFNIEAENAMGIVDKFNEVGNNFAISSTGIGEALQRSASALYEGGNTIDEAIGLITAANSVVQNPEQVGEQNCPAA